MKNLEDIYPLSPMQQGMLFHTLYQPQSEMYFEQSSWRVTGRLDVPALREAWQQVVNRHSALRTAFLSEGVDEPLQIVFQSVDVPFAMLDWRDVPDAELETKLNAFLAADRERSFELAVAPLMRFALIRLADDVYHLAWSHHHMLLDGWSQPLILRDLFAWYRSLRQGTQAVLPPTRPYRDYIAWIQQQDMGGAEIFWRDYLRGFTIPTSLNIDDPVAHREPAGESAEPYLRRGIRLPFKTSKALKSLTHKHQLTLNTVIQGAWGALLSRYSGEDDVVFGATVSGRPADLAHAESMVGLFINTVPVRVRIDPAQPVSAWLSRLQIQQAGVRQYEYTPLAEVQRWSAVPTDQPLFETLVVFENYPMTDELEQPEAELTLAMDRAFTRTNYPLTLSISPGDQIGVEIGFERARFDEETIVRLMGHFGTLLGAIAADPERPVSSLPLLTDAERRQIVVDWNSTATPYPDRGVHELIADQAARTPEAVAVVSEEEHLTYDALNTRANRLAHMLRKFGVGPNSLVGLCVERSPDMVIGILGILKAGGAYVPLPPDYPDERLTWMLEDLGIPVTLAQARFTGRLQRLLKPGDGASETIVVQLDDPESMAREDSENLTAASGPDDLAYAIYTSGSTGKPKGTLLQHGGLTNMVLDWGKSIGLTSEDRVLQFLSYGFDGSITELFPALTIGATIYLPPERLRLSLEELHAYLQDQAITVLTLTPSALAALSSEALPALKTVVAGGERCPRDLAHRWGSGRRFVNAYGPTEATVTTTLFVLEDGEPDVPLIPIGRPISNVRVYVLDTHLRPLPVGVPGELCIGGVGVGRGYLNRPDLTSARFVSDPFSSDPDARLYRSGDLVRYWSDGKLEFLGRVDDQVKIRGFRVELGEVEAALAEHPLVEAAAVVATEVHEGQLSLVAYIVPKDDDLLDAGTVRDYLLERLPAYMVPSSYVALPALPLSASGKVDRRALPAPEEAGVSATSHYRAPRTPVEQGVAEIWAQVLKLGRVSTDENFFVLGGHSLLATRVISRVRETFNVSLPVSALFDAPTVAELAIHVEQVLRDASGVDSPRIQPRKHGGKGDEHSPLSFGQQRLWFLEQLSPGNLFYNVPLAVRLEGDLHIAALEQSLKLVVDRHAVLRTTFKTVDGRPVQEIHPDMAVPLPVVDLVDLAEDELRDWITGEVRRPFDMVAGPLMRAELIRLAVDDYVLLVVMHHVITDGWSVGLFVQEMARAYAAFVGGRDPHLPSLPVQYADFARWQREWLEGEVLERQLDYWKEQLRDLSPMLELPTDRPRPAIQTSNGDTLTFRLPQSLADALKALSQEEEVTLFMTLLAAFQTLLYRYSGKQDIQVGTPIANRNRVETENLIGFFVNTLVMRSDLSGAPTFRDLLGRVRKVALGAYAHQDLPFEMLVEALHPQRDMSHTPLFQVMFVLDVPTVDTLELPHLTLSPMESPTGTAVFDLTLSVTDTGKGLSAYFEYNTDLLDRETVQRMAGHFETLLVAVTTDPDQKITTLPILTEAERQTMLKEWNTTTVPFPDDTCVHHLFEGQAKVRPDALAVAFEETTLTYGELNRRANQLAHHLRALGVGPEVLVGLSSNRSPEMVVGILGVLKAGGAYLPLDPTYPSDRLAFMLEDSQVSTLLTQEQLVDVLPTDAVSKVEHVVLLDAEWPEIALQSAENPDTSVVADNAAYVIYTSGSTGRPKGALLSHRGLCNLTDVQQRAFRIQEGSRVLQFSPLSFDASVWETFMALRNGGTLCLARQEILASGTDLVEFLRETGITTATLPPSMLRVLPVEDLPSLRTVIAAGEACTVELVKRWAPGRDFFNAYGPTETTVCASMYLCNEHESTPPPIGKPISNCKLYVLDEHMQPVPIGVPGELHIGGVNLSRGYLNRPDLTAQKFISNPFSVSSGERLYKTGDLVSYRPDGNIDFLGRIDHQVKVRGFRIELGEIEAVLESHPALREAAVIVREDVPGDLRLAAYLVPHDEESPTEGDLRTWVRQKLPEYMVPSFFVLMDALPTSPAGKIDRRALPTPESSRPGWLHEYVAPRTPIEEHLAAMGAELLNLEKIGVHDSFFDLGGHSLLATQLISRARESFDVELPLRTLFEHPTIAELATEIEVAKRRGDRPAAPTIQRVSRDARRVRRTTLSHGGLSDSSEDSKLEH